MLNDFSGRELFISGIFVKFFYGWLFLLVVVVCIIELIILLMLNSV